MNYFTVKDFDRPDYPKICGMERQNNYIGIMFENGITVKIRDWGHVEKIQIPVPKMPGVKKIKTQKP